MSPLKDIFLLYYSEVYTNILTALSALITPHAFATAETGGMSDGPALTVFLFVIFAVLGWFITRLVLNIMNVSFIRKVPLSELEKKPVKLLSPKIIAGTSFFTGIGVFFAVKVFELAIGKDVISTTLIATVFGVIALLAFVAQLRWRWLREQVFAVAIGTIIAFILLRFHQMVFLQTGKPDPFLVALVFMAVALAWRSLFGPWKADIKATVLGTFIGWFLLTLILRQPDAERGAYLLTIVIALIPAVVWCLLFLNYHLQRKSMVLLMFFAGMLSTAPILFYDALVKANIQLNFFLFRVIPENFSRTSNTFVSGTILPETGLQQALLSLLLSFIFVGLIEEVSKYWVTRKSGEQFFSSIGDVVQMSIIVAIGFACAENVLNPSYFQGFLKFYILNPKEPMWMPFLANVLGRSILTTMVHIVATGIMGYFLGVSLFARSYLLEARQNGRHFHFLYLLNYLLKIPQKDIFERMSLVMSLVLSTVVHGIFNFMVTLPNAVPGNPRTVGEMFGLDASNFLYNLPFLLIPSMLYVVGGFWLVSYLLSRKESVEERGVRVQTEAYVTRRSAITA